MSTEIAIGRKKKQCPI